MARKTFQVQRARVARSEHLTPTFTRLELVGITDLPLHRPAFDQRWKILVPRELTPDAGSQVLDLPGDFLEAQARLREQSTHVMRTLSVRAWGERETPEGERQQWLTFDIALHDGDEGPLAAWARAAQPGWECSLLLPCDADAPDSPFATPTGWLSTGANGVEFAPGEAHHVAFFGDETATPAIARCLEDLDAAGFSGHVTAYIEVPTQADVLDLSHTKATVHWLARTLHQRGQTKHYARGEQLLRAAGEFVGATASPTDRRPGTGALAGATASPTASTAEAEAKDALVWETPVFSASGEPIDPASPTDNYVWIAGESGVVTALRRFLVKEHAMPRNQVAFMGYWKQGISMRD